VANAQPRCCVCVEQKYTTTREIKGLDLVRRDWCLLSKEIGQYVLDQILSGDSREQVVENIHARMEKLKNVSVLCVPSCERSSATNSALS
jgi:DNA polymerase elongation subunit (family B)